MGDGAVEVEPESVELRIAEGGGLGDGVKL